VSFKKECMGAHGVEPACLLERGAGKIKSRRESENKGEVVALDTDHQRAAGGLFSDGLYPTEQPLHRPASQWYMTERDAARGCTDANQHR
jgi:hypothetical protein